MKTRVGIIGCGKISGIYCEAGKKFDAIEIAAVADIDIERARAKAAEHDIPRALTVEELLADPDISLVVNLTIPAAHASVARAVLEAGKSVYNEKPLTNTREQAEALLALAHRKGLRIGCAPDTFLGGGLQTCRKLIDDGQIGEAIGASAFMLCHGHEHWHPAPHFYYEEGGGPMFDMGPYYLTALTTLLGPVRRVSGSARASFSERLITSQPHAGTKIPVKVPTHVAGVLDFASGIIGTLTMSFDVWSHQLPFAEIYGSEGTLSLPDPNTFGGPVKLRRASETEWTEIPPAFDWVENSRGLGVAEMAAAIQENRPHRASGELAFHVLDIMQSIHEASRDSRYVELKSSVERPAPMPLP